VDMFGKPICFGTWVSYNNAVLGTCLYSFQTYRKVMVMNCCLDWILYVWQFLKNGEDMKVRSVTLYFSILFNCV
jgi:hypothetical protein